MEKTEKTKFEETIDESIDELIKNTNFNITNKHRNKIKDGLEDAFSNISNKNITDYKQIIVKKLSSALEQNNTWWSKIKNLFGLKRSYEISTKSINKIATHDVEELRARFQKEDERRKNTQIVKNKENMRRTVMIKRDKKKTTLNRSH